MAPRRILFAGYAPVHFVCFQAVYEKLRRDPEIEMRLSGGYRHVDGDNIRFEIDGFYDAFGVDPDHVIDADQARSEHFDVLVCAHLSDTLFPQSVGKTVQIFHGVSFKNLGVRDKALRYDYLCLPGRYHAEAYQRQGLLEPGGPEVLITGFPKLDAIMQTDFRPVPEAAGFDPSLPTLLFAPTGDKHNALELLGADLIRALIDENAWNVLVKPHDHPKNAIDWFAELAPLEGPHMALVRSKDVVPYLRSADLLITDASSVAFEYTLLDRPMLFIDTPKLFKRLAKRAPALDLSTYGRNIGSVVKTPEEATETIHRLLQDGSQESALRREAAAHLFHAPGHAADRVASVVRHAAGLEPALPEDVLFVPSD